MRLWGSDMQRFETAESSERERLKEETNIGGGGNAATNANQVPVLDTSGPRDPLRSSALPIHPVHSQGRYARDDVPATFLLSSRTHHWL